MLPHRVVRAGKQTRQRPKQFRCRATKLRDVKRREDHEAATEPLCRARIDHCAGRIRQSQLGSAWDARCEQHGPGKSVAGRRATTARGTISAAPRGWKASRC
ncbi:MAG: hypothetical protein BGO65_08100 [Afipia sp. 64-13]|nr:MAG: hypothetical protein BGO65_08100 [Afipia sp. 64-13]